MAGFERYGSIGFPHPNNVSVANRTNTGAGRHTIIKHVGTIAAPDGQLVMGQFYMAGIEHGALYQFWITAGKVTELEMIIVGTGIWDGEEAAEITLYDE